MNFNDFQTNVINLATERQIIQNSTAYMQALKLISEYGELCDAIAKGDKAEIIDAVGDISVCAVNYAAIHNRRTKPNGDMDYYHNLPHHELIGVIGENAIRLLITYDANRAKKLTGELLVMLQVFAASRRLVFDDCLNAAWNAIKERTGHMNENGVFIKDEAL